MPDGLKVKQSRKSCCCPFFSVAVARAAADVLCFTYLLMINTMKKKTEKEYQVSDIFVCARCGYCCQGQTTVSLDEEDQARMVSALNLSREEVAGRYWRITGNVVQMQITDGHCIFFRDGEGCTVHQGRPWRCGQWPLHPSILSDRANFATIRESCPGIRRDVSYEEFCTILRSLLARDGQLTF